jgi:hypothetical protein
MLRGEEATMATDVLAEVVRLAGAGRVVRLTYRPPGSAAPAEYVVEPYGLHRSAAGPALYAWQLSPPVEGRANAWREFRLDRVTSAADGGAGFKPRAPVTLGSDAPLSGAAPGPGFHGWGERPIAGMGDAEDYFRQLETAMLDGKVTEAEMALAESLRDRVEVHQRKAAHARVFAAVLHEVLQDGRISHREELYLANVRAFLERLGWAP